MVDLKRFDDFYKAGRVIAPEILGKLKAWDYIDLRLAELLTDKCDLEDEVYAQSEDVYDLLGKEGLYITVARDERFSQYRFCGACKKGENRNASPDFRKTVYICSPYRGETKEIVDFHVWFAQEMGKEVLRAGDIPVIPHLYFPQLLDDDKPDERELGLELGKRLLAKCDSMWICRLDGSLSEGMRAEAEYASNYTDVEIADDFYPHDFWWKKYKDAFTGSRE